MPSKAELSREILRLISADADLTSRGGTVTRGLSDAVNTALELGLTGTKQTLPAAIVHRAGLEWGPACVSAGGTVTLTGLTRLLEATELLVVDARDRAEADVEHQLERLEETGGDDIDLCRRVIDVVSQAMPPYVDGRQAVSQLQTWGTHWRQTEWLGFWVEERSRRELQLRLGGSVGPRFVNTEFDYQLGRVFDIKSHVRESGSEAILNDIHATEAAALQAGAIGFIVVDGSATYDDGDSFYRWRKELQGENPTQRSRHARRLKTSFSPSSVTTYMFYGVEGLRDGLDSGLLSFMQQGRQPSGEARRLKYRLRLDVDPPPSVLALSKRVPGGGDRLAAEQPGLFDER